MSNPWHTCLTEVTSVASVLAAVFSGLCAWLSYKLSTKIRDEMKSDERIILSKLNYPGLPTQEHDKCVLACTLFNKSKRKAFVNEVRAYNRSNKELSITWSNRINLQGNPQKPFELLGIVDTEDLFLRQDNGEEIDFCRLEVFHSFSSEPITALFDPYAEYMRDYERGEQ